MQAVLPGPLHNRQRCRHFSHFGRNSPLQRGQAHGADWPLARTDSGDAQWGQTRTTAEKKYQSGQGGRRQTSNPTTKQEPGIGSSVEWIFATFRWPARQDLVAFLVGDGKDQPGKPLSSGRLRSHIPSSPFSPFSSTCLGYLITWAPRPVRFPRQRTGRSRQRPCFARPCARGSPGLVEACSRLLGTTLPVLPTTLTRELNLAFFCPLSSSPSPHPLLSVVCTSKLSSLLLTT